MRAPSAPRTPRQGAAPRPSGQDGGAARNRGASRRSRIAETTIRRTSSPEAPPPDMRAACGNPPRLRSEGGCRRFPRRRRPASPARRVDPGAGPGSPSGGEKPASDRLHDPDTLLLSSFVAPFPPPLGVSFRAEHGARFLATRAEPRGAVRLGRRPGRRAGGRRARATWPVAADVNASFAAVRISAARQPGKPRLSGDSRYTPPSSRWIASPGRRPAGRLAGWPSGTSARTEVPRGWQGSIEGKANLHAPWLGITGFSVLATALSLLVLIFEGVRDAFAPRKAGLSRAEPDPSRQGSDMSTPASLFHRVK